MSSQVSITVNRETRVIELSAALSGNGTAATQLSALTDVQLSAPSAKHGLFYDNLTGKWVNRRPDLNDFVQADSLSIAGSFFIWGDDTGWTLTTTGNLTFGANQLVTGVLNINRLPFANSGEVSGVKLVLANDARLSDARAPLSHTHPWSQITSTPTTLAGYGITDAAGATHTHTFASITSKPTTLAGYGITDNVAMRNDANAMTQRNTFSSGERAVFLSGGSSIGFEDSIGNYIQHCATDDLGEIGTDAVYRWCAPPFIATPSTDPPSSIGFILTCGENGELSWRKLPDTSYRRRRYGVSLSPAPDSSNVNFTFSSAGDVIGDTIVFFKNGQRLTLTVDYLVNATTKAVQFTFAPDVSDILIVEFDEEV